MANSSREAPDIVDYSIPPEFEEAFQRVMISETLDFSNSVESLIDHKRCLNSLEAIKLLAKREIVEALKFDEEEASYSEEKLEELRIEAKETREQLYKTFLKHATISDAMQNIAFQTQLQNNFYESLVKGNAENDLLIRSILTNVNDNMNSSIDLVKKIEEQEQLEEDIFEMRVKHRDCLLSIENKWKIVTGQAHLDGKLKYQELEDKLQRREDRLSIVVGMLQGLITSSGEKWGSNPRLLQILLLCDAKFSSLEDSLLMKSELEELQRFRREKEKPVGSIDYYVTSTPPPKK